MLVWGRSSLPLHKHFRIMGFKERFHREFYCRKLDLGRAGRHIRRDAALAGAFKRRWAAWGERQRSGAINEPRKGCRG